MVFTLARLPCKLEFGKSLGMDDEMMRTALQQSTLVLLSLFLLSGTTHAQSPVPPENPDIPENVLRGRDIDREEFLRERAEQIGQLRGLSKIDAVDPQWRQQAVAEFEQELARRGAGPSWTEIGPAPIPNGQTVGPTTPVSGRTVSIAIHPTDPDIVFVGTASGGLYRSLDGGLNWTAMMDDAESLSIGALALAPSDPTILYVGTGEHNFSADSFFGVGVYRIDNPAAANPTRSGPFSQTSSGDNALAGRGISRILVHPADPETIFVSTTSGISGIGGQTAPSLPSRGIYRSTNATAADVRFDKLTGLAANRNASVRDIAFDPMDPNLLIANLVTGESLGGLYLSTDALAADPSFTLTELFDATGTSELTAEFATFRDPAATFPVFYAAVGNGGGRVLTSVDGGATWTEQVDNNFCTPQCFYDIAIAVDPTDSSIVYLGGSPAVPFAISSNSGASFTTSAQGLHVDSHVIEVSQSDPAVLYFGSDGGIYRSGDGGLTWTPLNNDSFSATQFMGLSTHPIDYQVTLGGTQDNGTNLLQPAGAWLRVDGGDGGYTGIDQNATDNTSVRVYHTYFNNGGLQGYATAQANLNNTISWGFRGCQGAGSTGNGITCEGRVRFYAPLVLGPGNPNTVYYGSDRLYRSADTGANHTVVSQNPLKDDVAISAIAIAANDDAVRVVGLQDGSLFRTLTGASVLDEVDPFGAGSVIPDRFIGRIAIDPTDNNNVYVALAGYAGAGQNIWKSEDFLSATPTWIVAATGIPNTPVSSLAIDPENPAIIYAGTDIGVFQSTDGGASWAPFGTGLPRVPVFGLEFAGPSNPFGKGPLRAATHGRGIWEIVTGPPNLIFENGYE